MTSAGSRAPASPEVSVATLFPVAVLTLIWGCNWPILKMGVVEIAPLTFRALTLPFAALGMLAVARLSGNSVRVPRVMWGKIALLALFNISAWNGLILFGLRELPRAAARSSPTRCRYGAF
jgi:drug/metabolite transporter (DMT)-like permease